MDSIIPSSLTEAALDISSTKVLQSPENLEIQVMQKKIRG